LFHTGSAPGIHPSEVSPLRRRPRRFNRRRTHIPFSPAVFPPPKRQTGPTGLGSWVHTFRECLATTRGFKPRTAGASHGVCPFRACNEDLDPDFSRSPLTRFAGSGGYPPNPPASQSIDRPSPRPARPAPECGPAETTLVGFLHLPDPNHSDPSLPGLLSSPFTGSHITADSPMILGHRLDPAEAQHHKMPGLLSALPHSFVPRLAHIEDIGIELN
jgi:hypothetical protein